MSYLEVAKAVLRKTRGNADHPTDLPPEWHLLWDERAAILEFDGGWPRERAEALALDEVHRLMRAEG